MQRIRFGVLGVSGHFIHRVLPPCRSSQVLAMHGVASRDRKRAQAAAAQHGIPEVFDSYAALVASPQIDAVFIPLPNHLHGEWIKQAVAAGKPVLCEKPLCLNASQAGEAVAAAAGMTPILQEHPVTEVMAPA